MILISRLGHVVSGHPQALPTSFKSNQESPAPHRPTLPISTSVLFVFPTGEHPPLLKISSGLVSTLNKHLLPLALRGQLQELVDPVDPVVEGLVIPLLQPQSNPPVPPVLRLQQHLQDLHRLNGVNVVAKVTLDQPLVLQEPSVLLSPLHTTPK